MRIHALFICAALLVGCASSQAQLQAAPQPAGSAASADIVPAPAPQPDGQDDGAVDVHQRIGGRRVIRPANGSTPSKIGSQRGQTLLGVDGDFSLEGVSFPHAIGSYARGKVVDYGSADGGYSVNYGRHGGVFATVYIYGDGADDAREMASVLGAIRHHYPNAQLVKADTVALKVRGRKVPAQYARVTFVQEATVLISDSVVMSLDGSFLKLRITGTEAEWEASDNVVRELLDGMGLSTRDWI